MPVMSRPCLDCDLTLRLRSHCDNPQTRLHDSRPSKAAGPVGGRSGTGTPTIVKRGNKRCFTRPALALLMHHFVRVSSIVGASCYCEGLACMGVGAHGSSVICWFRFSLCACTRNPCVGLLTGSDRSGSLTAIALVPTALPFVRFLFCVFVIPLSSNIPSGFLASVLL